MATEAFIFDAVRTPRGRGKKDGALHSVKPITLLTTVLGALRERNHLNTADVDDIVMGCVTAVGNQGADHRPRRRHWRRTGTNRWRA